MTNEAALARSGSECEIKARDPISGMGTKRALVKTGSYIVKLNNVLNMEHCYNQLRQSFMHALTLPKTKTMFEYKFEQR